MNLISCIFLIILTQLLPGSLKPVNTYLEELDKTIENRDVFEQQKQQRIHELERSINNETVNSSDAFRYYLKLSNEFQSYKFDSAFFYTNKLIEIAHELADREKIALAKTEFANILISAGMFSEAMDSIKTIDISGLDNKIIARYYAVLSRGYFDMESFSQSDYYSSMYGRKGMTYYDSALVYFADTSWEYKSLLAQKEMKMGNHDVAIGLLKQLIDNDNLTDDHLASQEMHLSFLYSLTGEPDLALTHMIKASIADFKAAKKEAVALLFVADYLFERGDVMRSSKYINIALDDNKFYGSSFRTWQISEYLPVIKSSHIVTIENQKKKLLYYVIIVTILSITVIGAIFIIYKQLTYLRDAKIMVEATNSKLELANQNLEKSNEELLVANRIKEEYVGYYFSVNTQMLEKLEKLKNAVVKKLKRRQYDEILDDLNNINIHKEKEVLFESFDKAFLKIFPDFVQKFNELLKPDEHVELKEGQLLNTDLRIFALVRLGIHDSEKIAKILDYSLNTIYSYKTRIKNKSVVPNEGFEDEVMKIKHYG